MHVLILPSWYPKHSGDIRGSFFREQALALAKMGCKVGVIALGFLSLRTPVDSLMAPLGLQIEDDEGVVTYRKNGIEWLPRMRRIREYRIRRWGVDCFERYIRQNGVPDIVHVHSIINAGIVALEIKRRYSVPYIVTEHSSGYVRRSFSKRQLSWASTIAKHASARFAVSTLFARTLEDVLSQDRNSWAVMPNIVNNEFFETARNRRNKPIDHKTNFVLLNVCMLNENKRVDLLLDAFAKAFNGDPNIRLRIGGDGKLRNRLEEQATRLGIRPQVDFLGMLSRGQVADEMDGMDVFVLSSKSETFGVVVIEALAKGKPVVVTRCGGPEDIVQAVDGLLVENGNIHAFTQALKRVHADIENYDSSTIRENCRRRFSEEAVSKRIIAVYDEVLHVKDSDV